MTTSDELMIDGATHDAYTYASPDVTDALHTFDLVCVGGSGTRKSLEHRPWKISVLPAPLAPWPTAFHGFLVASHIWGRTGPVLDSRIAGVVGVAHISLNPPTPAVGVLEQP